jgi:hypothetical protein
MKTQLTACPLWVFTILLPWVFSGCASIDEIASSTPQPILTDFVEATPTKGITTFPTSSQTSTPAWTGTSTITAEPTQTPTGTPMPPDEVREWISKRLADNGGCRLPCWWGITPGKTTWEETNKLLSIYASDIRIIEREDHFVAGFFFDDPPAEVQLRQIYLGFGVQNNVILSIRITGLGGIPTFSLSKFMEEYGEPGEVFVYAYHPLAYTIDPRQIGVHIYYPAQGIFAEYASPIGKIKDGMQQGCLEYGPYLTLVPPGQQRNYTEFVSGLGLDFMFPFRPVSEALGMDVETFYNTYQGIDQEVCLKTPVKIWVWGDPTPTP